MPGENGFCARSPATLPRCRSCTPWTARDACRRPSSRGCAATRAPHRSASATPPPTSSSSTSGARPSTLFTSRAKRGWTATDAWDLQVALMDHLEGNWQAPDNGLWEIRGPGAELHPLEAHGLGRRRPDDASRDRPRPQRPAPRWRALRDTIRADILEHGYDAGAPETFTQSYGSANVDASLLLIPRVGFLPGTDPRVLGTIDAVQRTSPSTGWCVDTTSTAPTTGCPEERGTVPRLLVLARRRAPRSRPPRRGDRLFERLLTLRNDVGLLSEQWDPRTRRQLGNTPQAFSHFALVVSALQLHMGSTARSDNPMQT